MATYWATPFEAVWDVGGSPLTLTQEGDIKITVPEVSLVEVKDNDHGDTPVDYITNGNKATTIEVPIADHTLATLRAMMPHATMIGTGRLEFRPNIGSSLIAAAKNLTLKRKVNNVASTDPKDWIVAPLAVPVTAIALTLGAKQSIWNVKFYCLPDANNNARFIFFGDETAS